MATLSHHLSHNPNHHRKLKIPTVHAKTYSELICEAIEQSPDQQLTLSEIYKWMIEHVPHCREYADQAWNVGWKNTIRHNLSQHREFKRIPMEHKHSRWYIDYEELEHQQRKRKQQHEEIEDKGEVEERKRTKSFSYGAAEAQLISQRVRTKSLGQNDAPSASDLLRLQQAALQQNSPQTPKVEVEPVDETVAQDWNMLTQLLNEVQLVNPDALKIFDSMIENNGTLKEKNPTIIESNEEQESAAEA